MCSASQGRVSNQKERRMKVFTQPAIPQTASPSYGQPSVSRAASTQLHQIGSSHQHSQRLVKSLSWVFKFIVGWHSSGRIY